MITRGVIFLGAPGVGKGTIAKLLEQKEGLIHISTGDIFRNNIKNDTNLGIKIAQILKDGSYVPDDITNEIVKKRILEDDVQKHGYILDGFPRTMNQAKFLKQEKILIKQVMLLEASDELIKKRLHNRAIKENRSDDTPDVIANRIKIYNEKTAPLIKYYDEENLLTRIDASGSIEENIENVLEELIND